MTTAAREPTIWDDYLVKEDNATPEEKRDRSRIAAEQWEQYRKAFAEYDQREAANSGNVEITSQKGNQ